MADVDADSARPEPDIPPHRYTAALAEQIEARWQQRWEADGTFHAANPTGPLADGFERVADRPKFYVLDMFPYPSGAGLHVGHPLGYIGTDVFARFMRMTGHNVLHTMGFDAFGLPAEQYAVETGQHPRTTTEANIANMQRQLGRLGLGHDSRRVLATTDVAYYRWTQWIFLQIFNSWYDPDADRARPIAELRPSWTPAPASRARAPTRRGGPTPSSTSVERRKVVDAHRLAYRHNAPVNWCPGLGTVLANEEVTADGRSERGNFPVYRRPLEQWMMRITAYAERLLGDLDRLDWPEPIKLMQRNWIGRSTGANVTFRVGPAGVAARASRSSPPGPTPCSARPTWCWRPSTRWWAGYGRRRGPTGPRWSGRAAPSPRPRPSRPTPGPRASAATSSARPSRARRPACSPARSRRTRSTASPCPCSSPTTC